MAKRVQRGSFIEVKSILPDEHFLTRKYDLTVMRLRMWMKGKATRVLKNGYKETIQGWKHRPDFKSDYSEPYNTRMQIHVYPAGRGKTNWQRVSDGTGPRRIVSSKGVMHFQQNYFPKTTPRGYYGGSGARSGPWYHTRVVSNHEIEPREFSERLKAKVEASLIAEAEAILRSALKGK